MEDKIAYICGPLTELAEDQQKPVKSFYSKIGDVCLEATGLRAFVPHEHYDPIKFAYFSPQEVNNAERDQLCKRTSVLIVVAIAPSWGGGIEVEIANNNNVPVVIIHKKDKKISRFLKGNPAVVEIIAYETEEEILEVLKNKVKNIVKK